MLRAGVTEVCITPPIGVELAGYGPDLHRYSTDIIDPLFAQALVLDDGHQRVVVAALDVIGLSTEFVEGVQEGVMARTGIPPENIMVAAIHSHTSPTTHPSRGWGMPDPDYVQMLARHVIGAVAASVGKLEPVELRVGRGEHSTLPWNRIGKPDVDPTIEVLRIDRATGEPLAIVVHFACHPVILGPKSGISPDYPGALRRYLREQAPGAVPIFLNGACGDIDPITQKRAWGQGTPEDVEQAGRGLGQGAWSAAQSAKPRDPVRFGVAHAPWALRYDVPNLETVRARIVDFEKRLPESSGETQPFGAVTESIEMPEYWIDYYRALEERLILGEIQTEKVVGLHAFVLAEDVALIAVPAEVYTPQGKAIRAQAPFAHVLPVCYANGLVGYIPPKEEFERQGYSASLAAAVYDSVPFQPDITESLITTAVNLLKAANQTTESV